MLYNLKIIFFKKGVNIMQPIAPLMIEHREIERLIALMQKEGDRIKEDKLTDIDFIDDCIDFIKTYADRCHHGKEDGILFKELENKKLNNEHLKILKQLKKDHNIIRGITSKLIDARDKYSNSEDDASKQIFAFEIHSYLEEFIDFYPTHIIKEEKEFFLPCVDYFTDNEKKEILDKFWELDRKLIHEKYREMLEKYE
jgi:hemerythrin-like domain-containing protein